MLPGFIAALLLVAAAKVLPAAAYTWANVQIGAGGFVAGIEPSLAQSGLFYARTDVGGAYRWSDTTQTWTPLTDMFPASTGNYLGIESLAPDPSNANNVYAAGGMYLTGNGNGVILSSTNQGASWTVNPIAVVMGGNSQGRGMGERLAVDPMLPSTLYYGSRENGLWKSTNSAATWAQITAFPTVGQTFTGQYGGTTPGGLSSVVIDGQGGTSGTASKIVFVASGSTAAGSNLYESVNGGAAWTEVTITAGGPTGLMVHHAALGSDGNLWLAYSNDIGPNEYTAVTWVGQIWKLNVATWAWTNVTPPTTEWPASGSGMAGGLSVDAGNPQHVVVSTLDWYSGPDRVLATTDGGTVWTVIGQPISYSGATVPIYNINGVNWWYPGTTAPAIGTGPTNWVEALTIDPFNADRVFHGCGGGVWQSLDTQDAAAGGNGAGVTWNFYDVGLEETVPLYMMPSVNGAFLGTVGDIGGMRNSVLTAYSSSGEYSNPVDNNNNWIDFAESDTNFVVRAGNSNTASPGPYNADVAISTNNGVSWTPCSGALPGYTTGNEMGSVAVNASGTVIVAAPYSGYGSPAYSTNNGASWTTCTGLPSGALVAADRVTATMFYATSGGTLYVSTNSGQSFSGAATFTTGGSSGAPRPVFKEAGEVWVATGSTLYRFTGLGGTVTTTNISGTYNLSGVTGVGFGISLTSTAHPAVYMIGDSAGVYGFYRNDDGLGDTWTQMNDSQHQYGWLQGNYIGGDESVYGRCYLTTGGRGYIYGSIDLTPTPTASVTLTDTLSATRSPTPSATPTQSFSATLSDSPSATRSLSPSLTPSPTDSATDSPTLSVTPSATWSATLSATLSATPSSTPSPTLSATPSSSSSPSGSPSGTPTATRSMTAGPSPTGSDTQTATTASATPSPTASVSGSATESPSPTATPSDTGTFSSTVSFSPSVSGTQTFTTASATPSPTASGSPTQSASATVSGSPSDSPTPSPTPSPSPTFSATPSATASATWSPTDSPSASPSPSASSSVTAGAGPTRTATASSAPATATPTATPSSTAGAGLGGTATQTVVASGSRTQGPGGPLRILSQVPVPNPNPKSLALLMDGPADGVEVRVWTEALVLVAEGWSGPLSAGWNRVPFPVGFPGSVPPGLYYVTVQATRGSSVSLPLAPARVLELR